MHLEATDTFRRLYRKLPREIQDKVKESLRLLETDPRHPSLRHRKMAGQEDIFEISVTMNYRITYQRIGEIATLRKVGTHDMLRNP